MRGSFHNHLLNRKITDIQTFYYPYTPLSVIPGVFTRKVSAAKSENISAKTALNSPKLTICRI